MTEAITLISQTDQLDVIVVGAHPDDVEIGVGGTIASLVDHGYKVGIIDLTDGEPTPNSPGPHVRLEEARAAVKYWVFICGKSCPSPIDD